MQAMALDLECENHVFKKRRASPFDPRNYIVQIGWSVNGGKPKEKYYNAWHREHVLPSLKNIDLLVLFNAKFDLLWLWDEPELVNFFKRGGSIYDGQYAEYLLQGMAPEYHMTAMNEIAGKYGGGAKIDAVKEMWENGYKTSEIPRDLLTDYLVGTAEIVGDVMNTWKIFTGQVKRMKEEMSEEFITMVKHRMDGLLASTEMEFNGMHIDIQVGEEQREQLVRDLEVATAELENFIPELPEELTFNWNSPAHKSCLIFGGTVKYEKWVQHTEEGKPLFAKKTERWPLFKGKPADPRKQAKKAGDYYVLEIPEGMDVAADLEKDGRRFLLQDVFKTGQNAGMGKFRNIQVPDPNKPKGAKKDHYFTFPGFTKPKKSWVSETVDAYGNPLYSTSADVIEELSTRGLPFTDALAKRTSIAKDLGTYYWVETPKGKKGMLTLVGDGDIVHHKLNHVNTVTARMSSNDPNLQNLPRITTSRVRKMFTSRFKNGAMGEVDYSQLEVVGQGVITRDEHLIRDLNDRVDFHCKRLGMRLNEPYEAVLKACKQDKIPKYVAMRTDAKIFSFQRAYGAGKKKISQSTGIPEEVIQAFIDAEEKMYPGIVRFDKFLEKEQIRNSTPTGRKLFINGVAFTQHETFWDSPTGTRYTWRSSVTPEFMHKHGKYVGYSPTERKNYPMQGFGGEVVQTMLGKVWRWYIAQNKFDGKLLMVNTVHDCLQWDGVRHLLKEQLPKIQQIMESVPEVYEAAYPGLDIPVPFPCESEVGNSLAFDDEEVQ